MPPQVRPLVRCTWKKSKQRKMISFSGVLGFWLTGADGHIDLTRE